jgi:hypothetical protein
MHIHRYSKWIVFLLLITLTQNVATATDTPTLVTSTNMLFRDDFNASIDSQWTILNQDSGYYSLEPDHLELRANYGDLWQSRNDYKNLFLIDNPTSGDFDVTMRIIEFLPAAEDFPQIDIVAYDDDDNHVRSIYGYIGTRKLEFGVEIDQVWTSSQELRDFGNAPFYLRLRKVGNTYIQYYSTDGIVFSQANSPVTYGDRTPNKLGFVAMVDPSESSVAKIDWFEITAVHNIYLPFVSRALSEGSTYTNPVYESDFPDPFVFPVDGVYYAYSTNSYDKNVPLIRSTNLKDWEEFGDALPQLPEWAAQGLTWAPSILQHGSTFILYYTARYAEVGLQCISRAVSDSPEGPFTDDSTVPFICQTDLGGSIDPSPFIDNDGKAYLLWKNDGNCCGKPVGIWIQQLSNDGLMIIGSPTELIQKDQSWEDPLIEGPSMVEEDGEYYLFYSANWWNSEYYAIGYAVCESITGLCIKPLTEPFFASKGNVLGPGGQEFFEDTKGDLWMAYHAWTAPNVGYENSGKRSLRIEPVAFADGKPVINGPTDTPQPLP